MHCAGRQSHCRVTEPTTSHHNLSQRFGRVPWESVCNNCSAPHPAWSGTHVLRPYGVKPQPYISMSDGNIATPRSRQLPRRGGLCRSRKAQVFFSTNLRQRTVTVSYEQPQCGVWCRETGMGKVCVNSIKLGSPQGLDTHSVLFQI